MVDKVKCSNKECKLFDVVVPVSYLYINKVAPLDGPCPRLWSLSGAAARW
jgi:hypothetical protein